MTVALLAKELAETPLSGASPLPQGLVLDGLEVPGWRSHRQPRPTVGDVELQRGFDDGGMAGEGVD